MSNQGSSQNTREELDYVNEILEVLDSVNIIQIVGFEWARIDAIAEAVAEKSGKTLYTWNMGDIKECFRSQDGTFEFRAPISFSSFSFPTTLPTHDKQAPLSENIDKLLEWFQTKAQNTILILEDFYPFMMDNPQIIRKMRDIARGIRENTIILSQPFYKLPPELEKDTHTMLLEPMDKEMMEKVFKYCCKRSQHAIEMSEGFKERLLEAALGLTMMEAERVFTRVMKQSKGKLSEEHVQFVLSERERACRK